MKTIILGDIHGWNTWKRVVEQENPDRVIFIGDYFDSFTIDVATQINNFLDICEFKRSSGKEVIMLIGNHDYHYFPEIGENGTSGYQWNAHTMIEHAIAGNRELLQMAYMLKEEGLSPILCTHAGVSSEWLDMNSKGWIQENDDPAMEVERIVNDLWKYKPLAFMFNGRNSYGDDPYQTPIWIRPGSLMRVNKQTILKEHLIQVVGHTVQKHIDIEGKGTGGRYFFIDTMGAGEFLIVENGEIKLGKIEIKKK